MTDIKRLEDIASQVRRDIVRMVHRAKSGHPGGSLGCADLLTALYFETMKHDPAFNMDAADEDVFILSNGHISPVWYSVLARSGYFPVEELKTFREINCRLQGHPTTHEGLPGVRVATGSLGQGLSVGLGIALSKKMTDDSRTIFCLTGDGELQEGQVWEAALFGAHKQLDNTIVICDRNNQQIDGSTEDVMALGSIGSKWAAFGWDVMEMDGNSMSAVVEGLTEAKSRLGKGKPVFIVMKTEMGAGVDFMMGSHKWHGIAPNDEQLEAALAQLPETLGDFAV